MSINLLNNYITVSIYTNTKSIKNTTVQIFGNKDTNIAKHYNEIIDIGIARFIIFRHQDIQISEDIIDNIQKFYNPDEMGVCGVVGRDNVKEFYKAGRKHEIKYNYVSTVDSCFFMIDKKHGLRFDEKIFDGLHLFCEDMCMQEMKAGRQNVMINCATFEHYGESTKKYGNFWGDWHKYYDRFKDKWKNEKWEIC